VFSAYMNDISVCSRGSARSKVSTRQSPGKGFIGPDALVVLVLHVEAGDVVRQEHNLVGPEFAGKLRGRAVFGARA